jgi:hypothetical protein
MGTCVTDFGYVAAEGARFLGVTSAAVIRSTASIAAFALNSSDAIKNYNKLASISSRALSIEEQQHNHLKNVYWPRETQFLNEFTQPTPWEDQSVLARRYAGRMWAPIASMYAKKLKEWECSKNRYCGSAYMRAIQELLVARATTKANVEAICDRIAFYEIQQVRDTDFERRKAAIALRQGLVGQAAALMQSAAQGLAAAGAEAAQGASQALQAFGYYGNRDGTAAGRRGGSGQATSPMYQAPIEVRDVMGQPGDVAVPQALEQMGAEAYAYQDLNQTSFTNPSELSSQNDITNNGAFFGSDFGSINGYNAGDGTGGMNIGDGK